MNLFFQYFGEHRARVFTYYIIAYLLGFEVIRSNSCTSLESYTDQEQILVRMARYVLLRHAFPGLCTDRGHISMHLALFKHLLHTSLVSYTCQGHIPSFDVLFHQLFQKSLGSYKDQISGTNFSRYGFLRTGSTLISWVSTVKSWRGEKS